MGRDYIPEADAKARLWMEAFARGIAANPSLYMLGPAQSASISQAVGEFVAALAVSSSEATRTRSTICAKSDARSIAQNLCRSYARLIKYNQGIDDGDKIAIGIPPINPTRQRRSAPQTSPAVLIIGATPGTHHLRFHDSLTPDTRAMPHGATNLQLFSAIGDERKLPLSEAKFCGAFTRNPIRIEHAQADAGKFVTYYGRWGSQRGEFGPWSLPVSLTIAA